MSAKGRLLGPGLATALVAGNMIGSGIYLLPASLGAYGSISLLGWIGALAVAVVFAAMFACAALLPGASDRGVIALVSRAFGNDVAFVAAGLYWLQALLGNVAIALAVTGYLAVLAPVLGNPAGLVTTTLLVIWSFIALNLLGPRFVGRFEVLGLVLGLLPVLLIGSLGWLHFDPLVFAADWNVTGRPDHSVMPELVVLVLWAFLGLESASIAAGLVENPKRTVPLATIGGVLLAATIYIAASTALLGIMPAKALAASTAPFADASTLILGTALGLTVALCAAFKASGTLAGWILLTARAAQDCTGIDRPGGAAASDRPTRQLLLAGGLMSIAVLVTANPSLAAQFALLINAVVVVMVCFYGIVGAALVRAGPRAEPSLAAASRWLGGAGMVVSAAIIATQDKVTVAAAFGLVVCVAGARFLMLKVRAAAPQSA